MKPSDEREEVLFREALQRTNGTERAAFLEQACAGNEALRGRLESLLQAHERADTFLEPQAEPPTKATMKLEFAPEEGPGTIIGRYKLLEKVGEGGFGVVYVAEQREPVKRRVALKIIKLGMDTKQVVARFEAERQALALMDHPNIAKVLDAGATDTGRPYFVMELVKGIPITKYCDQEKLTTRDRLDLFIKVCHAIQHAHQKGIIHRDIKPSNILVTLHDGVPVPKVIDFGIAKATQQELTEKTVYTQLQQFIGTPAYMSPEQAEMSGLDIDTRSDIYSLGVLLYELLTGSTPFDTKELVQSGLDEMRKIIREREPVRPSTRLTQQLVAKRAGGSGEPRVRTTNPSVEADLDWIVMKCLEKDRTRRYETANGLAMDLKRHLNHEPVLARPPSVGYRLQKSFRRNKLAFSAGSLVGLALVLGGLVSSLQAIRATRAGRLAEREKDHAATEAARARKAEGIATAEAQVAREQRQRADAATSEIRQNLYASDMLLAHHVREDGNLDLTLSLLNRHRPAPGETDLRGWEWRYLWSVCQSDEVATFATNSGSLSHVVISPDGSLLSTAEWGPARTAVRIWDFAVGRLLATPETNDATGSVAFSPNGRLLAFGTRSHGLKLWDMEAHQEKCNFPGRYGYGIGTGLAFSQDGTTLAATSGAEPAIMLWNIERNRLPMTFRGHSGWVTSLVFSPDGKTLISGSWDHTIRLWSTANGQEIARLTNHADTVNTLALSADGRTLASGGFDKTIRIWDLEARLEIAVLTNHTRWVSSLAFSPDQKTLASGSADFLIKLWDTVRWREVSTLRGNLDEIYAVAFAPNGKTLISGAKNGMIKTWNPVFEARRPDVVLKQPEGSSSWWLGDQTLIYFHANGTVSYWNPATLRRTAQYDAPEDTITNVIGLEPTPSGRMVWANKQSEIVVWDLAAQRELGRLSWVAGEEKTVTVSPNEKLLVAAAAGKCLTVWDLERLQEIASLPKSTAYAGTLAFSHDLHMIAAGNSDGTVEVWDLHRKALVGAWQAHKQWIDDLAFMPDGKRLVTVSDDATARLWEIETGRELIAFTRTLNAFDSVAISPDGQRIAAGTFDGLIKIWISKTGQEIAALRAGEAPVFSLHFQGPDGNTLVSVTSQEARLWRAPTWEAIAAAEQMTQAKTQ